MKRRTSLLGRRAWWGCPINARQYVHKTWIEFHPKTQPKLLQFVLDFVQRFLAKIAILQHFGLGFLRKLTNGGDIRVVQTIGGAHAELDLIHAHVEQLLELYVLFAHPGRRFVELDHVFVEVDENIEVMAQNRRGLEQRVIRRQSPVGPDFQDEFVVIGALTNAGIFDRVFHARDRRKNGIDWDQTDRLIGALVFLAAGKAAADANFELSVKFVLLVERANQLLGIKHFVALHDLDIASGDFAFLVHAQRKFPRLMIICFKFHLLKIEDDVSHVLDHSRKRGKFMLRPANLNAVIAAPS